MSFPFNVRVYGVLIHDAHILLSDEVYKGRAFTKLPGGGLAFGEGLRDALKREFLEEAGVEVKIGAHIYTTDFFQVSAFNPLHQVVSVYYRVGFVHLPEGIPQLYSSEPDQLLRWKSLSLFSEEDFTFPIDKHVASLVNAMG